MDELDREYQRAWKENNKEHYQKYQKEYREAHKDKMKAYQKEYKKANLVQNEGDSWTLVFINLKEV